MDALAEVDMLVDQVTNMLGAIITRPKLSSQLLKKPPFIANIIAY